MVRVFFTLLTLCLTASLAGPAKAQMLEQDMERPGATYHRTAMGMAGPQACWRMCANDQNCKAWTWQRPGIAGPQAVCQLKTAVMPGQKSPCCVSGLSSRLEQKIELAFARPRNAAPMMTPRPMRPIVSPGDPVRQYPIAAARPIVQPMAAPVQATTVYKIVPPAASAPAPAYSSSRILGEAPVQPVAEPQRKENGAPVYSVNREFAAAPSKVSRPGAPNPEKKAKPVQQATNTLPAGSLQLLGD